MYTSALQFCLACLSFVGAQVIPGAKARFKDELVPLDNGTCCVAGQRVQQNSQAEKLHASPPPRMATTPNANAYASSCSQNCCVPKNEGLQEAVA